MNSPSQGACLRGDQASPSRKPLSDEEFAAQVRECFPREWLKVTPAKARILQYLVDNGPTRLWPGEVMRSLAPLRRLEAVGYVERLNRLNPGLVVYHLTTEGRAALAGSGPTSVAPQVAQPIREDLESKGEG